MSETAARGSGEKGGGGLGLSPRAQLLAARVVVYGRLLFDNAEFQIMTVPNVAPRTTWRRNLMLIAFAIALAVAGQPADAAFIAYVNPAGNGNSFAGGPTGLASMGMDFDVNSAITVTSLGAFDFAQDGQFLHDVVVGIFDRDTQSLVGSTVTFSTASPGTLIDGSRFISLSTPLQLSSEFHGSIVAFGYSSTGGGGGEPFVDESNNVANWTLNDGGGLLSFVGTSRYSVTSSLAFPAPDLFVISNPDHARNQFEAGTFQFEASVVNGAVPEPSAVILWLGALATVGASRLRRQKK